MQAAGLDVVDSYVSITEVSEYAKGMPEHMLRERLYPSLPPEGKPVFCFYPMTKRREAHANWYATPFDERNAMMREHGKSGRTFAGKVVQLITGSTGLDDFEWGVTLFAVTPEVVKDVVYTMRFDKGSALYGEFGRFYVGYLASVDDVLDGMGSLTRQRGHGVSGPTGGRHVEAVVVELEQVEPGPLGVAVGADLRRRRPGRRSRCCGRRRAARCTSANVRHG